MADVLSVGCYGKLPQLGDFITRRVSATLVEPWDAWLQQSLAESREALAGQWLDLYLTAPMWRFLAPAGVLDALPVAGVMFPSVDRVGRCFPFTVFARLPQDSAGLVVAERCAAWFERVEDLVLAQLDDVDRSVDELDAQLVDTSERLATGLHNVPSHLAEATFLDVMDRVSPCLHLPLGDKLDLGPTALAWLDQLIAHSMPGSMFWWSSGSSSVRPSWLITRGLPEPRAFCAMLNGTWQDWPWASGDAQALVSLPEVLPQAPRIQLVSAGSTHPGNVRSENQDAFIARPEIGLWAVADGMGGHDDGQLASQATRDALAELEPRAALPEFVAAVRGVLSEVNDYLYSLSLRPVNPKVIGTTVVVLLIRDGVGVAMWAGDSRLYRLRDGALEQLTADHSEAAQNGLAADSGGGNVITNALGGRAGLDLEQASFDVCLGDRFLLCSDGLYRELSPAELTERLESGEPIGVVDRLIGETLQRAAADNVTAVVVHAQSGAD